MEGAGVRRVVLTAIAVVGAIALRSGLVCTFWNNLASCHLSKAVVPPRTAPPDVAFRHLDIAEEYGRRAHITNPADARPMRNVLQAQLWRGYWYARQEDWSLALASYQAALATDPDSIAAHVRLGEILTYHGASGTISLEMAIGYLTKAAASNPRDGFSRLILSHALWRAGRRSEAVAAAADAARVEPQAYYFEVLCGFDVEEGQWCDAIAACGRSLELEPERPGAWFSLGEARAALGDSAEARLAWQRVVDLAPDSPAGRLAVARLGSLSR